MKLADAEKEFRFRIYAWAKAEWEKEINGSFPHLRLFKTGHAWNIYQFMQRLNKEDQLALALGRLKRSGPEEASEWGDQLSEKEDLLCRKFDAFSHVKDHFKIFKQLRSEGKESEAGIAFDLVCAEAARTLCDTYSTDAAFLISELDAFLSSVPKSFEEQVKARKQAGEKMRFVSKKKLQKILTQRVKDVFASQYVECSVDEGHWTAFDLKYDRWMLMTQFTFGRQQSLLKHGHSIGSERRIQHPVNPTVMYPAMILCGGVCWPCSWHWEYLLEEDVELACDETLKYCRHFFDAAPKLLKGFEVESISE